MSICSYFACAGLLALTLPALAAPEPSPSTGAAGVIHGSDAGIMLAQGGGPPPHARGGQGRKGDGGGRGGDGGGRGGGGGSGGGPAIQGGGGGPAFQRGGGG